MTKLLKITVSGSYRTADDDIIDFEGVTGTVPFNEEDVAAMHARDRYVRDWIRTVTKEDGTPKYTKRIDTIRQIFIDDIVPVNSKEPLSFLGKDIRVMTEEEMQDMATALDLRTIQLPRWSSGASVREMRERAYKAYSEDVLGTEEIKISAEDFNFAKLPPLVVNVSNRHDTSKKITNEEMIDIEQKVTDLSASPKTHLTRKDMEGIAKEKNIPFHPNISDENLYKKLFPSQNVA